VDVTLVGIAGGSCAGKTTLAEGLAARLGDHLTVLQFDHYYHDHGHLPVGERALVNYDHPDSLDERLFVAHLDELAVGSAVEAPVYDFSRPIGVPRPPTQSARAQWWPLMGFSCWPFQR